MVSQLLKRGVIPVDYIETKKNLADPLTKSPPKEMVSIKSKEMGLRFVNEGWSSLTETQLMSWKG